MNEDDILSGYDALSTNLLMDTSGNSEQAWIRAQEMKEQGAPRQVTGNAYFQGTGGFGGGGRINAGIGTGDIAQRDPLTGNITGYRQRNRTGSLTPGLDRMRAVTAANDHDHTVGPMRLLSASSTPGLDAFHAAQPKDSIGKEIQTFSWTPKQPKRTFAQPLVTPPPAHGGNLFPADTGNLFA